MAAVEISHLRKSYSRLGVQAIDDVTLTVEAGELLVLLGPSGCGKTTTLRCIAGLESPTEGTIKLGDQTVFDGSSRTVVPAERRDIGMVFQGYALWPHLTVLQNIQYPLRARRMKTALSERWAESMAEVVGCSDLLDRRPGELSGGQQQRIALARALVARPSVMLFDEPLSNLDAGLRVQLRREISRIHRELGFTGVYVTHDQVEAFGVADQISVLRKGKLVQHATPDELRAAPANEWCATFMGYSGRFELPAEQVPAERRPSAADRYICRFHPRGPRIVTRRDQFAGTGLGLTGKVVEVTDLGSYSEVRVKTDLTILDVEVSQYGSLSDAGALSIGQTVQVVVDWKDLAIFAE